MIAYWVDLGFYFTTGEIAWRFPIAIQIIFAVIMIVCMVGCPIHQIPMFPPPHTANVVAVRLPPTGIAPVARLERSQRRGPRRTRRAGQPTC